MSAPVTQWLSAGLPFGWTAGSNPAQTEVASAVVRS